MNETDKTRLIKVIEIFFPNAKIYLFGSRAKNTHNERSDYDIAIDAERIIDFSELGKISSMIDALNIAQKVDVVDFNRAPQYLKDNILKHHVVWKN